MVFSFFGLKLRVVSVKIMPHLSIKRCGDLIHFCIFDMIVVPFRKIYINVNKCMSFKKADLYSLKEKCFFLLAFLELCLVYLYMTRNVPL